MIDVCRRHFPKQEWIVADMRKLALRRKFSGILAWDSFFHLCHDDQRNMFPVFREHAAPRAALMFTSGPAHGEAIGSFGGEPLYHASLDPAEYRSLLDRNGFRCGVACRRGPRLRRPHHLARAARLRRWGKCGGERWSLTAFCDYDPVKKKADIGSNFLNGSE